jgi:hypothetical protein
VLEGRRPLARSASSAPGSHGGRLDLWPSAGDAAAGVSSDGLTHAGAFPAVRGGPLVPPLAAMDVCIRLVRAALAAALALSALATSPAAAGIETGDLFFEVTLSGPIPEGETFAVSRFCRTGPDCFDETIVVVCSPDALSHEPCTARKYVVPASSVEVGRVVEYGLWRTGRDDLHSEQRLQGTWEMVPGRQVIRLGFAFPAPVEPAAPAEPPAPIEPAVPTLPDTAVTP